MVLFGLVEIPSRRARAIAALRRWALALPVALLAMLGAPGAAAWANTFVISNSNDTGKGSLRQAIAMANKNPGMDTVTVVGGTDTFTVDPVSPLPAMKDPIYLNALHRLIVNDTFTKSNVLTLGLGSDGSTISGLAVEGATGAGIRILSGGNLIAGVVAGDTFTRNATGISIASANNTIGGITSTAANTIGGNSANGILLSGTGATGNLLLGNDVGIDAAGGRAPNGAHGIAIQNGASNNTIGGTAANTIAFNTRGGVLINGSSTTGNPVLGNLIFQNGPNLFGPGIQLSNGGNGGETTPVITFFSTSPGGTGVAGTGVPGSLIQVFVDPSCADPEGAGFLDRTTVGGDGSWGITTNGQLPSGSGVTATQTDKIAMDTSMFSRCASSG